MIPIKRFIVISLFGLLPLLGESQNNFCDQNFTPGNDTTYVGSLFQNYGGVSGAVNSKYRLSGSLGQTFVGDAFNQEYQSSAGFYSAYLLPPTPPVVFATQGDLLDRIQLNWSMDPLSPAPSEGFNIYRDGIFLGNVGPGIFTYNDFNVIAGRPYEYVIRGINNFGEGFPGKALGFQLPNGVVTGWIQTPSGSPVVDARVSLTPEQGFSTKFGQLDGAWTDTTGQNVATLVPSGNQPWSISFWMKTDSATNNAAILKLEPTVLEFRPLNSANGNDGIIVHVNTPDNLRSTFPVATRKEWHHIVLTYTPELSRYRLYVDGLLDDFESGLVIPDITRINFGEFINKPGYWTGRLDELRIYNKALDVTEIQDIALGTASTLTEGLLRYWKMDEGEGTTVFDLMNRQKLHLCGAVFDPLRCPVRTSGITNEEGYYRIESANYGTGTTFIAKASKDFYLHRALQFKSSEQDYARLPHFQMKRKMTFEFWINHDGPQPTPQTILSKTCSGNELKIQLKQVGTQARIYVDVNNISQEFGFVDVGYHNIAVTMDSLTGLVRVYRNGAQLSNFTFGPFQGTWADTSDFVIGAREVNNVRSEFYNGLIDEVAMYDTTLTQATIQSHLNMSRDAAEKKLVQYYAMDEGSGNRLNNSGSHLNDSGENAGAEWTNFATNQVVTPHVFSPGSRQVTLNPSVTSVDQVDFTDRSTVPVSGYVRYKNTDCFAPNVEILVNGLSNSPPVYTDSTGKFLVEFDPGMTTTLTPKLADHVFSPVTWEIINLSSPVSGILFSDLTTRTVTGKVAGGLCEKSVIRADIPPGQGTICKVKLSSIDQCYSKEITINNQEGNFSFEELPPLEAFTVAVTEHSNPKIKNAFQLQGGITVDISEKDTTVKFIYFEEPEVILSGGLEPYPGCSPPIFVLDQGDNLDLTFQVKEQYEEIIEGGQTIDDGVCLLDTADLAIIDGWSDLRLDTTMGELSFMYSLQVGIPNPSPPHLRFFQIIATSEQGQKGSLLLDAVVTGIRNKENTFTTQLPEVPILILRDPPGDQSYSYWEKNNKVCTNISTYLEAVTGTGGGGNLDNAPDVKITFPLGGPLIETEWKIGFGASGTLSYKKVTETSMEVCMTTSERISTSSDETVVGEDADVYVGLGANLAVGFADEVFFNDTICQPQVNQIVTVEPLGATTFMYSQFHIKNNVIRYLDNIINSGQITDTAELDNYITSRNSWNSFILDNAEFKKNGMGVKNLSFDAGVSYEFSQLSDTTNTRSFKEYINSEGQTRRFIGGSISGVGFDLEQKFVFSTSTGTNLEGSNSNAGIKTGYVLGDNDAGDAFSVDVSMDTVYQTPVFNIVAGQSSCPWEAKTAHREVPLLSQAPNSPLTQINVPANEKAVFKFNLGNASESIEDWTYGLTSIAGKNPHGAIISVNGTILNNNTVDFVVPYGTSIPVTITVERGPVEYIYQDLEIALVSTCELERNLALSIPVNSDSLLYSSLKLGVEFIRPCSEVDINVPEQNWVIKNGNPANGQLNITVSGYDLSSTDFKLVRVQYRKTDGDGAWINIQGGSFRYNPNWSGITNQTNFLQPDFTQFTWNTSNLPDGNYEIHAWAECTGLAADKPGFSHIIKGKIDREPPKLIAIPEPSDGVFHNGDEISFTFNKNLDCSGLLPATIMDDGNVGLYNTSTNALINYTFSCHENKITIIPTIAYNDEFENKILRAELHDIKDRTGNNLVYEDWEFYVDRNELAWLSDSVGVTKFEDNSVAVTAKIHNRGGYPVGYELSNIPAHARVVPDRGTLVANEIQEVTIYIDSSLALGHWLDTLVLTTVPGINPFFMGGDEPLKVGVRVICHSPDWYVNPADYSYSMNMTLQLNIEDTLSTDVQDRLGAFINGQLAGVGKVQYNADLDKYLVFLTIYHNTATGDTVTFQIWDASACVIYGNIIEEFAYLVDELVGTPNNPQVLHTNGQILRKIHLQKGWNWMSYNVHLLNSAINPALSSMTNPMAGLIKSQTEFSQYSTVLQQWVGNLDSLSPYPMFQLKASARDSLSLIGQPVDPTTPINLSAGWNWIGFLPQRGLPIEEALGSLSPMSGDIIKSQTAFAQYVNGFGWIGNLQHLASPNGYLIKLADPDILMYPAQGFRQGEDVLLAQRNETKNQPISTLSTVKSESSSAFWKVIPQDFEYNMNAVVVVKDGQLDEILELGDLVGVFFGNEVRGVGEVYYIPALGKHLVFLTFYANNENEVLNYKLYDSSADKVFNILEPQIFKSNAVEGSVDSPKILHLDTSTGADDIGMAEESIQVYPNPAESAFYIRVVSGQEDEFLYYLRDLAGNEIFNSRKKIDAGMNNLMQVIDPRWKSGPYMLTCRTSSQVETTMVMIIKP